MRGFLLALIVVLAVVSCHAIVNREVTRDVDLTTQFEIQRITIEVLNDGSQPVSEYVVALTGDDDDDLAHATAKDSQGAQLKVGELKSQGKESTLTLTLAKPLAASATTTITVMLTMTHAMEPFPAQISQLDPQFVKYDGNAFFYSPYQTKTQTTVLKLASSKVDAYTQTPAKVEKKDNTITYGPYQDIAAKSESPIQVHFENNKPFLSITKLVREIEISHWGNVAVEEWYWVEHAGAKLEGSWSRADYFRPPHELPFIKSLKLKLPASADDVYYRDDIGNISTSFLRLPANGARELELLPRFPLFGGWKTNFYMGYNLPLSEYLSTAGVLSGKFRLTAPFAIDCPDAVIDYLELRVILPEGASNFESNFPFAVEKQPGYTHKTYLDTTGRPVFVVSKKNVVTAHNQPFQLTYNFARSNMMHEPILLVSSWAVFFAVVMIWVRLDISISGKASK